MADGHVAVVAHDHEQEGVGEAKRKGEEHLAGTGHKGDGAVGGEHVRQHARGDCNSEHLMDMSLSKLQELVIDRRSLESCSPWGCKELDTTE